MNDVREMRKKVNAVIFDWAGTTVDYGSFAPVHAFLDVFRSKDIEVTAQQIRKDMGILKKEHLRRICSIPEVEAQWLAKYGRKPDGSDLDEMYRGFEPALLNTLAHYSDPLPGIAELVQTLRRQGMKIGSTTGYSSCMMDILMKESEKRGYRPDVLVTPDEVSCGRPAPFMIYLNAIKLGVYPMDAIVKVGDTPSDIQEALNAGVWSVGIVKGGNELGLTLEEVEKMLPEELEKRCSNVRERFFEAGAHYVAENSMDVLTIIEDIDQRLRNGESSCGRRA